MNNWKTDYRVKYHITFTHEDGRTEDIHDERIIEASFPEEVEEMLVDRYENSDDRLIDCPDDWFGHIKSGELEIDEITKIWEHS